ncbi:hypothetical protein Alches_25930 [Alicyclobacillus hesperidum subsp. aegles]|uniref:replication-relaxation family protein n=1 Tax=Alicyclobacillus TaxID=29330 RepID=UPI001194F493|nr:MULTISPECIES: replication-relaxation family protein [Alicyclobacillus]GEO27491.1 hypothetical protein AAC03nite_32760 [Alicyclobacillus acidoterrestris]GLG02552.1 hypothetical protein Alches_25930 [Alicyclobacillus hesperidum subsp. aegles]
MILNWADGPYTDQEKLIGTIYDAGVIRRSDLMYLLDWKRSKTDSHLLKLRQQEFLQTSRDHHKETVYMLAENGVRFAHQLCQIEAKIVTMQAQISHQLGVNDILMRYIRVHGREGVRWFSTREASDELHALRYRKTRNDAEIRRTCIRPDAAIHISGKGLFWLEFDNATENSKQLRKKFALLCKNLDDIGDERVNRVVWVTPTAERARWLEQRWKDFEDDVDQGVQMMFYTAGEETVFLAGIKEQQTV